MKFLLPLDGLQLKDSDHGLFRRHAFILFNVDGKCIYRVNSILFVILLFLLVFFSQYSAEK